MNHTITALSDTEQELTLTLEPTEFQSALDERYKSAQEQVQFKGFRKGKVPLDLIKRTMGKEIEAEAVESLAGKFFADIATNQKLKMVGRARIRHYEFKEANLAIYLQYEVQPEFELKPYENYDFKKAEYTISDHDIDHELFHLLEEQGVWVSIDREAKRSDSILADTQKLDEGGMAIIGQRQENQQFDLRQLQKESPIYKALIGTKAGDERVADIELRDAQNAPQVVKYKFIIKEVKELELPELTDELAKELSAGKLETAQALREDIKTRLGEYYALRAEDDLMEQVAKKFVDENSFSVPSTVVSSFENMLIENAKQQIGGKFPKNFNLDAFRREIKPNAERQAKWMMIRYKIADEAGIKIDEETLKEQAAKDAVEVGMPVEQLTAQYLSDEMRDQVIERALRNKVYDYLKSKVKIETEQKELPHDGHNHD